MSIPAPGPEPEVVVINEKPDDGNVWMWAVFGIILLAIILIIVGVCMSNKHHKQLVIMSRSLPGDPLQGGGGCSAGSLYGGGSKSYASALSVSPMTASVLNSSVAPMSFMPY